MYSEDDAVAKVDGYLIEVADGISYVGEKMLVRIVQADRTAARAVLAEVAEEAAAASEERRKTRERSAKRAASAPPSRARRARKPATQESQAVEALTEGGVAHAGTGPGAADDSDEDTAKPRGRRRSRSRAGSASASASEKPAKDEGSGEQDAVAPVTSPKARARNEPLAWQAKPRPTTRYNRSLGAAAAEADGAVRVRTPKSPPKPASDLIRCPSPPTQ